MLTNLEAEKLELEAMQNTRKYVLTPRYNGRPEKWSSTKVDYVNMETWFLD